MKFNLLILFVLLFLCGCSLGLDKNSLQHSISKSPSLSGEKNSPIVSESPSNKTDNVFVSVFYANSKTDPDVSKPEDTYPVKINFSAEGSEQELALKTMEMLIKGPDEKSKKDGFYTTIPPETKIQSIIIDQNSIAVDFNKKINAGGGSCEMTQRRSQIENTLKSLPGAAGKKIIISADGDSEKVLQP